jgi:hypothetical protein
LYAIVPYFNPWRWKSRVKHTERAVKHFHDSGAVIVLVEIGFNRRELVFADAGLDGKPADCGILGQDSQFRHRYIGLHTEDELWLKENAINIGIQSLPHHWQQVCWLDGDVHFLRPNWVGECIHKLQHYSFLQMFSQARDLSPTYEMLPNGYKHSSGPGFIQAWKTGKLDPKTKADLDRVDVDIKKLSADFEDLKDDLEPPYPAPVWPGLAWACTREAFDNVGGLFDVAIWGGGDYDMAHALIEQASLRIHRGVHAGYRRLLIEWENRCKIHIRRNVGVMDGVIFHQWHGKKTDRKYVEKRQLMQKVNFDPLRFLKRDYQNLWQLHDDGSEQFIHFRDQMRKIAKERNEDSIDTE